MSCWRHGGTVYFSARGGHCFVVHFGASGCHCGAVYFGAIGSRSGAVPFGAMGFHLAPFILAPVFIIRRRFICAQMVSILMPIILAQFFRTDNFNLSHFRVGYLDTSCHSG